MKIAIAASLIASAAAFAPVSQQAARSTALNAYENELGVQTPVSPIRLHRCVLSISFLE
jgi:hypothetical protein